jgi:hypothetical protein
MIDRETGCSTSTIANYFYEHGIVMGTQPRPRERRGQVAYGQKMRNGSLVPHLGELEVVGKMRQLREQGLSFAAIVAWMTENGVKTKNGVNAWDRPTIYKIIKRSEANIAVVGNSQMQI